MSDFLNKDIQLQDVVVIDKDLKTDQTRTPFLRNSGRFVQISKIHNRSFKDAVIGDRVLWADEFNNKFMTLNVKGRPPKGSTPYLEEDKYSYHNVRTHWLCDTTNVFRTETVSNFLRSNGLATERIRRKSVIKQFELNGQMVDAINFKKYLISQIPEVDRKKYEDYLNEVDFYEIEREMPVDERIEDLLYVNIKSGKKVRKVLEPTFKYLKLVDGIDLDVKINEDVKLFFTKVLPEKMGKFLGKFHDLGLEHMYAGGKNWILAGKLIDLDSVYGLPFGDDAPTDWEIEVDLDQTLGAISTIFMNNTKGEPGFIQSLFGDKDLDIRKVVDIANNSFLHAYMSTRNVSKNYIFEHIDQDNVDLGKF